MRATNTVSNEQQDVRGISVITPLPMGEGSNMWGYPYWPACMGCYEVFLLCLGGFSLTDLTDLTEPLCALFRAHRRPLAYRYHRTLQLKVAVRFCEIG